MNKRTVKTEIVLAILFGWVALMGCIGIAKLVYKDYKLYQAESECVRIYQMKNYSRNEIQTGNGTCWIKGVNQ